MIVTNKVTMDLTKPAYVPVISAVQNDRYSRNLELTLCSGGEAWTVPEEAAVVIRYSKSDGKGGEYDTLPDGTQAWSAAENVLTVALAPQVLTAAGPVHLMVALIQEEQQISTFAVLLNVQAAVNETIGESEDYCYVTRFLPAPSSGSAGQLFRIASVDDQGRVTGVEAVGLANVLGTGEPMEADIPKVFLTGKIPTTKEEVLAKMEYISRTESFRAYLKIKCQGNSSMNYPKKNFTIKMYADEARETKLKKEFRDWGQESHKYVLKANYIDHSHARNIVSARVWNEIVSSRPDYGDLPEEMRGSPRNGAVDGFPVKLYTNGTYQGIYTWNIGKDDWMWGMDEDNASHVLLCGETNTNGTYGENACNFRALWSGEDGTDWTVEVGSNSDAVKDSLNALIGFVMENDGEDFRAGIGTYLDVLSAIDYYLFSYVSCGLDSLGQNLLLATYDGVKWICGQYDMDSTFGLWWDGSKFVSPDYACPDDYQEPFSLLWERLAANYPEEMKVRYLQLRDGALSLPNMVTHFERFTDVIGPVLYVEDLTVYPGIPSSDENNLEQLRNFIRDRLAYVDQQMGVQGEETEDTEESEIPAEYTKVSYLASSGTQYIDTGVSGGTNASYEIRFSTLGALAVSYEQYFAGVGDSPIPKLYYANGNESVVAQLGDAQADGMWILDWSAGDTEEHTFRYDGTTGKIYLDDAEVTHIGYSISVDYIGNGWGDKSWYVFNSAAEPNLMASMQLSFLKMYTDGELIRNFVPVVRNSDGAAGLFDIVSQTFYGNAGTGTFTVGA